MAANDTTPPKFAPEVPRSKTQSLEKIRVTYHLTRDLSERVTNAVIHLSGPPRFLTLSGFVEEALAAQLVKLEKSDHQGRPFPTYRRKLKGGRPLRRRVGGLDD